MNKFFTAGLLAVLLLFSCGEKKQQGVKKLPYMGHHDVDDNGDTVYHTVPAFELIDQDSIPYSYESLGGKIHIADFFFTNCQTICPQMTAHMKKVAKRVAEFNNVVIVSFTVDPENDSPSVLKQYAEANGIDTKKWKFLTGDESYIHDLGGNGYMLNALRDSSEQGGFLHSEYFVMVDAGGHVRGMYDGTSDADVERLIRELEVLIKE
jgi:protein SCO1/2